MRILLIEDEIKLANFIRRGLVAESYAVDLANDGRSGLELWETYQYDLVILDLSLPVMDGTDVLRCARKRNSSAPVLILSARDNVEDKVRHIERGADDYLTKPFAYSELLARIKALMRRGPANATSSIRIRDLEIDRLSKEVQRAGRVIPLTAKEYALLEYLMSNAGRVLSRDRIIEHVWDLSFDGVRNIVDVYIRQLRGKVDDGHELKLLHTVRGVGYTICDRAEA